MKYKNTISAVLGVFMVIGPLGIIKDGRDDFALWRSGVDAVLLPVQEYKKPDSVDPNRNPGVIYTTATLQVKLPSGEFRTIPNGVISLAQINQSQVKSAPLTLRFVPGNPKAIRYAGEESDLGDNIKLTVFAWIAGLFWFPFKRRMDAQRGSRW